MRGPRALLTGGLRARDGAQGGEEQAAGQGGVGPQVSGRRVEEGVRLVQRGGQQLHQRADLRLDAEPCGTEAPVPANPCGCSLAPQPRTPAPLLSAPPGTVLLLVEKLLERRLPGHEEVGEGLARRALLQEHDGAQRLGHRLVRHRLVLQQRLTLLQDGGAGEVRGPQR